MTTTKLTDTHRVILSQAAHHPDRRVLPLPKSIRNRGGTATRALKSLLRREFVQEVIATPEDHEWARAHDGKRLTLTITPAGLAAIGVSEPIGQKNGSSVDQPVAAPAAEEGASRTVEDGGTAEVAFRVGTKGAAIVALLRRDSGATLADLMTASGWQRHSVRGFLSGTLKKKHGLLVTSEQSGGTRRYRIAA